MNLPSLRNNGPIPIAWCLGFVLLILGACSSQASTTAGTDDGDSTPAASADAATSSAADVDPVDGESATTASVSETAPTATVEVETSDTTAGTGAEDTDANRSVTAATGALHALQARLEGDTPDNVGSYCFQGADITKLNGAANADGPGVAWLDMTFDGLVTIFAHQDGEIPTLFTGSAPGQADGIFDLSFRADAGATSPPAQVTVTLTDTELRLDSLTLSGVACDQIPEELDGLFVLLSTALGDLPPGVERLADAAPTSWRFASNGPVNARSGPGLAYEVTGTWQGDETGVASTGRRARADGFDWVELAADGERDRSWVAQDFIEEE